MANKKILDIIPPKKVEVEKKEKEETLEIKRSIRFPFFKILIFGLILIILTGGILHFKYSRAEIEIWPQLDDLNLKEKIEVNAKTDKINLNSHLLPGKIFEIEKEIAKDFPSSGKVLKKAEGTIRVFNNYSKDQVLVKNTRFISANGKLFYSKNRILIPAGGYTDVEVVAAEGGAEYNIEPSIFSIPGLVGLPQYSSITGKSFSKMKGGGEASVILPEDLDKAKNNLGEELLKLAKSSLESEANEDFILPDEAISQEIIATSGPKIGEELDVFNFQIKEKIRALAFKKSDLGDFTKKFILSQIPTDKKLEESSLKINWKVESADLKSDKIILNLEISAKIYSDIDENSLKQALSGKSLKESQMFLDEMSQINNFKIKFWPFSVKRIPEDLERIKIKLMVD